jgi:apolipoprotein N-acyltransferase
LFIVVESTGSPWRRFGYGWIAGAIGHAIAFAWLTPVLAKFQGFSLAVATLWTAAFVAYVACQFGLFALLAGHLQRSALSVACALTALWVSLEWAFPKPFPWSFGQILGESPALRQAVDLGGVYGLGVIVAFVNAAVAVALARSDRTASTRLRPLIAATVLLLACRAYGEGRLAAYDAPPTGESGLRVAVVQGGLPKDPGAEITDDPGWSVYSALTDRLAATAGPPEGPVEGPDLVVWPEKVLQGILSIDRTYRRRVETLVGTIGTPLLVGAADLRPEVGGETNAAYLVSPPPSNGRTLLFPPRLQIYHKSRLVPFAEYVPAAGLWSLSTKWKTTGPFVPGRAGEPTIFTVPLNRSEPARVAPSICYEAIWPGSLNPQVRSGAELLINITDDSWFEGTGAPNQHLRAVILRAVETRRWLVRASNSGISAIVDPTGRIVASVPWMEAGVVTRQITLSSDATLYVRAGDWPLVVCGLLLVSVCASSWWPGWVSSITRASLSSRRDPHASV